MSGIVPLDKLVTNTRNIYELTQAMIEESRILSKTKNKDGKPFEAKVNPVLAANEGKVCSTSIKQILENSIEYEKKPIK